MFSDLQRSEPPTFVGDFLEQVGDYVVKCGTAAGADHGVCNDQVLFLCRLHHHCILMFRVPTAVHVH